MQTGVKLGISAIERNFIHFHGETRRRFPDWRLMLWQQTSCVPERTRRDCVGEGAGFGASSTCAPSILSIFTFCDGGQGVLASQGQIMAEKQIMRTVKS